MGEHAQKRLIRKLDLGAFPFHSCCPTLSQRSLEQYTSSEQLAANMLYIAAYVNEDIVGRSVLDLGCGTGRLSLGASFLGAREVVGVDIDRSAIKTASENSNKVGVSNVQWVIADIGAVVGSSILFCRIRHLGCRSVRQTDAFLVKGA